MKITIEGQQGCGKTKIADQICSYLAVNGYYVVLKDGDNEKKYYGDRQTNKAVPALTVRIKQTK